MGKYWTDIIQQRGTKIDENKYQGLAQSNKMPYYQLKKAWSRNGRVNVNVGHTCGLNALNMANKMLGYSYQWDQDSYPYTWIYNPIGFIPGFKSKLKWGLHSGEFGNKLITPNFKTYNWKAENQMPWDVIDGANFLKEVVIVLVQYGLALHYILLIGADDAKKWYITTDQSDKLHWISRDALKDLMKIDIVGVRNYCAYRVG